MYFLLLRKLKNASATSNLIEMSVHLNSTLSTDQILHSLRVSFAFQKGLMKAYAGKTDVSQFLLRFALTDHNDDNIELWDDPSCRSFARHVMDLGWFGLAAQPAAEPFGFDTGFSRPEKNIEIAKDVLLPYFISSGGADGFLLGLRNGDLDKQMSRSYCYFNDHIDGPHCLVVNLKDETITYALENLNSGTQHCMILFDEFQVPVVAEPEPNPVPDAFKIAVRRAFCSRNGLHLTVNRSTTVHTVMDAIKDKMGIPHEQQQLVYQGDILEASKTLVDYNIKNGCVVSVMVCCKS